MRQSVRVPGSWSRAVEGQCGPGEQDGGMGGCGPQSGRVEPLAPHRLGAQALKLSITSSKLASLNQILSPSRLSQAESQQLLREGVSLPRPGERMSLAGPRGG